ncbi:AAA family ATPase [Novosphingobium album (ex Hu et al. 2023)]|uniref:ATP-binding protein n=1 Tax=Novosphingobium album (ex Hu et al. 2023) TaxID=2930093 RepID=A0ABT0AYL6_9SPHN|nr:ATP-binding protein [Novosphingobium album (ex Hu et al. 2023)]MCJ2177804.1 ATP-binding protein [Novosphingobium album (ex Hu et al. 2023)]
MKLAVERAHLDALIAAFAELEPLRAQLRFGEKAEVPVAQLSDAQCAFLGDLYRGAGAEYQVRAAQLTTLRGVLGNAGKRYSANDLEDFLTDFVRYLLTDGLRGWLFSADISRRPLPYVVTRLDYTPTTNDESGKIFVELKANAKGTLVTNVFRVTAGDIDERTLGEVLVGKGFLKETPDLIAAYDATAERYFAWRGRYGEQFAAQGRAFYAEDPTSARRDTDWTRKDVVVLSASGGKARLVNDEGILTERSLTLDVPGEILASYLRRAGKSNQYDNEEEIRLLASGIPADMFIDVPVHAFVLMFHLDLHHYVWAHVDDMEPYAYQPALKGKLVLPPEQTDLIDILTAEMDVLMDDIVEGKSGGTTVLCAGPPGVGKTLTAEVYSEIIRRPLYRVHSGQLGLNVTQMEASLKDVLTRAQRWGAVMLIDEADVYIKRREDDMTMNAVVGVFLRVLEYFNGLLFLTTNRVDDIDEAIVSRCIALIRYHQPDRESRARIWRVMVDQFGLAVSDPLVEQLADLFPEASGRDIKGLAKLTAKYCSHKGVPPGLEVFQRCSIFRGMDMHMVQRQPA